MIKATAKISSTFILEVEHYLFEFAPHNWVLHTDPKEITIELTGFFESTSAAKKSFEEIFDNNTSLQSDVLSFDTIHDEDWKNSYKKHFKPWNIDTFHWVPIWEEITYIIPNNHKRLLLDPGMAFGTGNHETTKLCLQSIIDNQKKTDDYSFIDVGCGSGILALTASLIGYKYIDGMDSDSDSIKVSNENAKLNNIKNVIFELESLENISQGKKYDFVIANIQADILKKNSQKLINIMSNEGTLVISGILATELSDVEKHYTKIFEEKLLKVNTNSKTLNDWGVLEFHSI